MLVLGKSLLIAAVVLLASSLATACCSTTRFVATNCGGGTGCRTKMIRQCEGGSGNIWEDFTGSTGYCNPDQSCAYTNAGVCVSAKIAAYKPPIELDNTVTVGWIKPLLPTCQSLRGESLIAYIDSLRMQQSHSL